MGPGPASDIKLDTASFSKVISASRSAWDLVMLPAKSMVTDSRCCTDIVYSSAVLAGDV